LSVRSLVPEKEECGSALTTSESAASINTNLDDDDDNDDDNADDNARVGSDEKTHREDKKQPPRQNNSNKEPRVQKTLSVGVCSQKGFKLGDKVLIRSGKKPRAVITDIIDRYTE
jgi:hypothetical protein